MLNLRNVPFVSRRSRVKCSSFLKKVLVSIVLLVLLYNYFSTENVETIQKPVNSFEVNNQVFLSSTGMNLKTYEPFYCDLSS